jgi:hypothetical protein
VVRPEEIDANIETVSGDLTVTDDDRMLLAEFSAGVWESENIKLCPRPFAAPGIDDRDQIGPARQQVMQKLGEHGMKLLQETDLLPIFPEG